MNKIERFFPHLVSLTLLVLAGLFKSPAFAYASVLGVLGVLVHSVAKDRLAALVAKQAPTDETVKRAVQDLNARVTTIEYNVKTRGF